MSLVRPHLPSPAPTPDEMQTSPAALEQPAEVNQTRLRADLEAQLLRLSQDLYEMEICAGEVGANMEEAVPNYLLRVNQALVGLSEMAGRMTDSVARQVVENVDQYRNPHTYTKNALTRATGENQYALGRALGLESFRRQLHDAIGESFPAIPLPERRHRPPGEPSTTDQAGERILSGEMEAVKEEVDREVPLPADGPPAGAQPSGIDGLPTTAFQPLANGGSS